MNEEIKNKVEKGLPDRKNSFKFLTLTANPLATIKAINVITMDSYKIVIRRYVRT